MNVTSAEIAARQDDAIDSRYHPSAAVRRQLNKVFPTHWSFLLGEVALYSFIVLLLTGVYLTLFFDPSMAEVTYNGVYEPMRGIRDVPRPTRRPLDISFEVRGGLFVRQVHHWAALMFAAAIMVHLARIFFTGAFRRPREANWVIGFTASDPGHIRGLLRLLAARRPAVGHGHPRGAVIDHTGHPADRNLAALGAVRRRLSRRHPHPAPVLHPHPDLPGHQDVDGVQARDVAHRTAPSAAISGMPSVIDDSAARDARARRRVVGQRVAEKYSNMARIRSGREPIALVRWDRKAPVKKMRARCTMIAAANVGADPQWWT